MKKKIIIDNKPNLISFDDDLKEMLKDPEFRKGYESLKPQYDIIKEVIIKRHNLKMSQKDLAKKMGTRQSAISRLESGDYNPSFKFLKRLAEALESKLRINFI
ncbi:MAG: helix-turn-helix transcriptional regulator [Candidatus Taylorbacteria bacterium]|nr:helix-turn-helix transcriptional regulator [Candidatus Taylorbacteria bacterium]